MLILTTLFIANTHIGGFFTMTFVATHIAGMTFFCSAAIINTIAAITTGIPYKTGAVFFGLMAVMINKKYAI